MKTRPFLGVPASFHEAFPTIEDFEIQVDQDGSGWYTSKPHMRFSVYGLGSTPPRMVTCLNTRCQQGGLDLNACLISAVAAGGMEKTFETSCNGHEGSPKGRRMGNPCDNWFKVSIKVRCQSNPKE